MRLHLLRPEPGAPRTERRPAGGRAVDSAASAARRLGGAGPRWALPRVGRAEATGRVAVASRAPGVGSGSGGGRRWDPGAAGEQGSWRPGRRLSGAEQRAAPSAAGERGPAPLPEQAARRGAEAGAMGETKIIYHLDGQETPYLVKLPLPAERVTLADFKGVLQRPSYKFFFKSMDDDFG